MEEGEEEKREKKEEKQEGKREQSIKEERIRKIALSYYSRPDIRKAMYEFSKNRECVPRYFEGFGKRPDMLQFDLDILELAKKGATSFHCSEELWHDPLQISTSMAVEELKKIRQGWDLLIDVDSKYLDYSKIYTEILVDVLRQHGIKNLSVKFSGSKGFHVIIPWKAFPKEISGKKTAEMFPEWPRLICQYLNSKIVKKLKQRVEDISEKEEDLLEIYCIKCDNPAEKKYFINLICPLCRTKITIQSELFEKKRKISCINCGKSLDELTKEAESKKEYFFACQNCNTNSRKNQENFSKRVKSKHIDADLVLVSSRHLFRMPNSLHEKTGLASIVISPENIKNFDPKDADPMRITPKNFLPNAEENEAAYLLREALEFKPIEEKVELVSSGPKKFKDITLENIPDLAFPPSIQRILEGMKSDGRKRALFILLNFFKSLNFSDDEIKAKIESWNTKNYEPLRDSYIRAQLMWYAKNKAKMPPNFDKPYYRDIGINPTPEEIKTKNPVSYTIKKALSLKYKNGK